MSPLFDYTFFLVLLGTCTMGLLAGMMGVFAMLRKESLLGDAISHATLPGIAIAFFLTHSKKSTILALGAFISAWIGALFLKVIFPRTRLKNDAALGTILSVFFGWGTFLLSIIQRLSIPNQAGLHKFLFGNAATLLREDLHFVLIIGGLCSLGILLFWKEFTLLSFDREFAQSMGVPVKSLDLFLTGLTLCIIICGIQISGVILMSATLIAPAAAARQWTNKLEKVVLLSCLFGATGSIFGTILSSMRTQLSTGPLIVLFLSLLAIFSLFFAPCRGIFWKWMRGKAARRALMKKGRQLA